MIAYNIDFTKQMVLFSINLNSIPPESIDQSKCLACYLFTALNNCNKAKINKELSSHICCKVIPDHIFLIFDLKSIMIFILTDVIFFFCRAWHTKVSHRNLQMCFQDLRRDQLFGTVSMIYIGN